MAAESKAGPAGQDPGPMMPPDGQLYGESFVDMDVASSKSPEEITDEGRAIFDVVERLRAAGLDPRDEERLATIEASLRKEHPEFSSQFPIVFKWIVQAGEFVPEVFRRWLIKTQTKKVWNTRGEWLESQAEYLTRLYKYRNPRASSKDVSAFTNTTIARLKKEESDHKRIVGEVQAEMEGEKKLALDGLRARLTSFCRHRTSEQLASHLRLAAEVEAGGVTRDVLERVTGETRPAPRAEAADAPLGGGGGGAGAE